MTIDIESAKTVEIVEIAELIELTDSIRLSYFD